MSAPRSRSIWPTRRDLKGCYVTCAEDDLIHILHPAGNGMSQGFALSRHEARMLAKRINQCLDSTVKR